MAKACWKTDAKPASDVYTCPAASVQAPPRETMPTMAPVIASSAGPPESPLHIDSPISNSLLPSGVIEADTVLPTASTDTPSLRKRVPMGAF